MAHAQRSMQVCFEPEDPNDMSVPHVARLVVDGLILGEAVGADDATALASLIKQLHENHIAPHIIRSVMGTFRSMVNTWNDFRKIPPNYDHDQISWSAWRPSDLHGQLGRLPD
jgi:hypothetical protein